MIRAPILAAVLVFAAAGADAQTVQAGPLTLSNLAVRASLGTVPNSAAYLTIANAGDAPDRLMSIDCACARLASPHRSQTNHGVTSMVAAGPVVIPAHGKVTFVPGGLHIMLTSLNGPLTAGGVQEMTLHFEHAGAVKAVFRVRDVIAAGDDKAGDKAADMPGMPGMQR
jgi:copper(I)-binding protein